MQWRTYPFNHGNGDKLNDTYIILITGAGFGVMIPVSFTAFNCYFTKRRTAMMSANQTMSSMASITFPILVTYLLAEYGFRWTLALIMAVDLHLVFAMLVMHPVEWHLIKTRKSVRVSLLHFEYIYKQYTISYSCMKIKNVGLISLS